MPLSSVVGAQSIVRPGVCTSSTRPASPYDGQVIYETDTDKSMVWNGSVWQYFSAPQTAEPGAYIDYSASQNFGGFTKGNATVVSKYTVVGSMVHFFGSVVLGSTSSLAGPTDIGLPLAAEYGIFYHPGSGWLWDTSPGAGYMCWTIGIGTTAIRLVTIVTSGAYASNSEVSTTVPFAWASGDSFYWNHTYKKA